MFSLQYTSTTRRRQTASPSVDGHGHDPTVSAAAVFVQEKEHPPDPAVPFPPQLDNFAVTHGPPGPSGQTADKIGAMGEPAGRLQAVCRRLGGLDRETEQGIVGSFAVNRASIGSGSPR